MLKSHWKISKTNNSPTNNQVVYQYFSFQMNVLIFQNPYEFFKSFIDVSGNTVFGKKKRNCNRKTVSWFPRSKTFVWISENIKNLSKKLKSMWIGISILPPHRFHKVFLGGSMLLDFGFLTEKASWIHRILKIWCLIKIWLKICLN